MKKYSFKSDCCKAGFKKMKWGWLKCKKCGKRCIVEKLSTDYREKVKVDRCL